MRHPVKLERLDRIERIVDSQVELVAQTVPKVQVVFDVLFKKARPSTPLQSNPAKSLVEHITEAPSVPADTIFS